MKRNRRISAVTVMAFATLVTGTGAGFAATTTPSATPVATHAFATAPATATAPTRSFQGTLPAPTGPYAAGEDVIHLTDWSRLDPWVPSSGPRQLAVTMVYPAVPGTGTPAPYMTLAEAAGHIQQSKIPASSGITPQNVSSVTTHAFDGARPQRRQVSAGGPFTRVRGPAHDAHLARDRPGQSRLRRRARRRHPRGQRRDAGERPDAAVRDLR